MEITLDKEKNFMGFSGLFSFMCCSCKQPINDNAELVMINEGNNNNNENEIFEEISNDELTNKKVSNKIIYLNKFKDNDSYNDYIIKLDDIHEVDNSLIDQNDEKGDENKNGFLNSQLKDKDDSFTNS